MNKIVTKEHNNVSKRLRGAGGVGGLLAVKRGGTWHVPLYDASGNVTAYLSESGAIVAEYEYDAFGNTVSQSGALADDFNHRFSTKYYDTETGLYYYGLRYYSPVLRRWISEAPIGEAGGVNLYAMCGNSCVFRYDHLGLSFGTIGPNTGSVIEHFGGESVRYESDLWFAVYGESGFNLRRRMEIKGCKCRTHERVNQTFDYFSIPRGTMWFGQGNVAGDNWSGDGIKFKSMHYAEIIAIPYDTFNMELEGTVNVLVQLTKSGVKPSNVSPNTKRGDGFGTENSPPYGDSSTTHPIQNFQVPAGAEWQPQGIIAEINFTLELDCDKGMMLKSSPVKKGDWKLDGQNWHRAFGLNLPPRAKGMPVQLMIP